jgi:hypothetical protein
MDEMVFCFSGLYYRIFVSLVDEVAGQKDLFGGAGAGITGGSRRKGWKDKRPAWLTCLPDRADDLLLLGGIGILVGAGKQRLDEFYALLQGDGVWL